MVLENKDKYLEKVADLAEAKNLIPKGSYYELEFKGIKKQVINKKGVYHLKELYDIKTELLEYYIHNNNKGYEFCYHIFKAIDSEGNEAIGFGGSDRREFDSVHNAIATSATRAEVRAILELVAFGSLSGIEFTDSD